MQSWDPLKNDRMTKIICVVVCCAIAAYFLAAFLQSCNRQVDTVKVVRTVSNESAQINGMVVRSELVLDTDRPYLSVTASSGEAVAAGSQIALAVDSRRNWIGSAKSSRSTQTSKIWKPMYPVHGIRRLRRAIQIGRSRPSARWLPPWRGGKP